MLKYCPTCNRSSNDTRFIGEFCEFCIIEKVSKGFPISAKVEYCKRCNRIRTSEGYKSFGKEALGQVLAKALTNSKCKITVKEYGDDYADVIVTYPVDNSSVEFNKRIALKLVHQICQDDYRKSSGYYEAIVQLRGDKTRISSMSKKLRNFAERRGAFIARVEEHDTGIDMYVSDKALMKTFFLYNRLKPKASYTLYSVKNGKRIFRNTYMLKLD